MKLFVWIMLLVGVFNVVKAYIEIKRIECVPLDKAYAEFEYCRIVTKNSHNYFELMVKLYQFPVYNLTTKITLMKKINNGFKPFLYTITFDACKFFENRKLGLVAYFYSFIEYNSNMNHSCPYNHDLIVNNIDTIISKTGGMKYLPMPYGEYALFTTWMAFSKPRGDFNVYFTFDSKN